MTQSVLTQEQYLDAIAEQTSESILLCLIDFEKQTCVVVKANGVCQKMFGRPLETIVGIDLEQLLPERYRAGHFAKMIAARAKGSGQMRSAKKAMQNKVFAWNEADQTEFPVVIDIAYPVYGGYQYAIARVQDDSERSALRDSLIAEKDRLRAERDRLALVLQVGDVGLWTWDAAEERLEISDSWFAMSGQDSGTVRKMLNQLSRSTMSQARQFEHLIDWWAKRVHASDVESARKVLERYLLMQEGGEYSNQYRYKTLDAEGNENGFISISSQGRATWDDEGQLASLVIAQTEITELAEESRALKKEIAQIRAQYDAALETQAKNTETLSKSTEQIQKLASSAKIWGPTLIAALSAMSDFGQELISRAGDKVSSIGERVDVQVGAEASYTSSPISKLYGNSVADVLRKPQWEADLILFGHYELGGDLLPGAALETTKGTIDAQVLRGNVEAANDKPWRVVGQQPFESRAIAHIEGNCHVINGAAGVLNGVTYQASCPILLPGESEKLGFVALELQAPNISDRTKQNLERLAKELAIEVQETLDAEQSGSSYAKKHTSA